MAFFSAEHVNISGIAACVPSQKYDNTDYKWVAKGKQKNFIDSIGIASRHISPKGTTASDLCFDAAELLIEKLKWHKEGIKLLVFVSCSGDYTAPATAAILQHRLGLPKSCMAFDINMACSGYVYGLSVVSKMISTQLPKALLLVGDVGSVYTSYKDKSSFPLFGDAGTATAIEYSEKSNPVYFDLNTDGSGFEALYVPDGGSRYPITKKSLEYKKYGDGIYRKRSQIFLNGVDILKFSLREVPPHINKLLNEIKLKIDDIDYFVLHQANKLINANIGKMLKISPAKMPDTLLNYGNTISASIPLTIVEGIGAKEMLKPQQLLLCGFGAGLSWGTVVIKTENLVCPAIIMKEIDS